MNSGDSELPTACAVSGEITAKMSPELSSLQLYVLSKLRTVETCNEVDLRVGFSIQGLNEH